MEPAIYSLAAKILRFFSGKKIEGAQTRKLYAEADQMVISSFMLLIGQLRTEISQLTEKIIILEQKILISDGLIHTLNEKLKTKNII